jgi:PAS domain S-box-containing protein
MTPPKGLRHRAEDWLRLSRQDIANMPVREVQDLVHELQVHQVELQMQNEDLRQAQADLEASRDKYWNLFDFAPVGYFTLDTNGIVIEANLVAAQQLQITRHELNGLKLSHFIAPEFQEIFHLHNRKVLVSKEPQICQIELLRADKSRICMQMHSVRMAGEKGQYRSAITDITHLKQLEAELIAARDQAQQANQAKSQFLANMSHEIRTPLNAIIGLGHILKQSKPLTPTQREQLGVLQSSSSLLLNLINELLDIAKIEANSIEFEHLSFDLSALLKEVMSILAVKAQEKGLELIEDNHLRHHLYWGDAMRIRQIIVNLLGNAIKFTHKGEVVLRVEAVSAEEDWANILLSVSDTGIGIPRDKQVLIFDTFTQADASMTRRYGGSGLGLAICKQLAEHMGGSIQVTSIEGIGSTFTLQLPLRISHEKIKPNDGESEAPLHSLPASSAHKPCILLVEDYATNVLIATAFLDDFSYGYDIASNGEQAVQLAGKNRYDLILMDVQMQGVDGYEATRQIRQIEKQQKRPPTPIIAMTAHALCGDKEKCLQAGMSDYISKPFNPEELRTKLDQYLCALNAHAD